LYLHTLLYIAQCSVRNIRLSDYRTMAIGLLFFLLLDYRNIKYRTGEF
jgi:hypothetical protein